MYLLGRLKLVVVTIVLIFIINVSSLRKHRFRSRKVNSDIIKSEGYIKWLKAHKSRHRSGKTGRKQRHRRPRPSRPKDPEYFLPKNFNGRTGEYDILENPDADSKMVCNPTSNSLESKNSKSQNTYNEDPEMLARLKKVFYAQVKKVPKQVGNNKLNLSPCTREFKAQKCSKAKTSLGSLAPLKRVKRSWCFLCIQHVSPIVKYLRPTVNVQRNYNLEKQMLNKFNEGNKNTMDMLAQLRHEHKMHYDKMYKQQAVALTRTLEVKAKNMHEALASKERIAKQNRAQAKEVAANTYALTEKMHRDKLKIRNEQLKVALNTYNLKSEYNKKHLDMQKKAFNFEKFDKNRAYDLSVSNQRILENYQGNMMNLATDKLKEDQQYHEAVGKFQDLSLKDMAFSQFMRKKTLKEIHQQTDVLLDGFELVVDAIHENTKAIEDMNKENNKHWEEYLKQYQKVELAKKYGKCLTSLDTIAKRFMEAVSAANNDKNKNSEETLVECTTAANAYRCVYNNDFDTCFSLILQLLNPDNQPANGMPNDYDDMFLKSTMPINSITRNSKNCVGFECVKEEDRDKTNRDENTFDNILEWKARYEKRFAYYFYLFMTNGLVISQESYATYSYFLAHNQTIQSVSASTPEMLAEASKQILDKHHRTLTRFCPFGYDKVAKACKCYCDNGIAASNDICATSVSPVCDSCIDGYMIGDDLKCHDMNDCYTTKTVRKRWSLKKNTDTYLDKNYVGSRREYSALTSVRHGRGKTKFFASDDCVSYVGHYKDDKMCGYGKMKYTDNSYYYGNWNEDKPNGKGFKYYPDEKRMEYGQFKDGEYVPRTAH